MATRAVELQRDGTGGFGFSLSGRVISRVKAGTAASDQLKTGDLVVSINGKDVEHASLTHMQLVSLVRQSPDTLKLVVKSGKEGAGGSSPKLQRGQASYAVQHAKQQAQREMGIKPSATDAKPAAPKPVVASKPSASVKPSSATTSTTTSQDPALQKRLTEAISRIAAAASKLGIDVNATSVEELAALVEKLETGPSVELTRLANVVARLERATGNRPSPSTITRGSGDAMARLRAVVDRLESSVMGGTAPTPSGANAVETHTSVLSASGQDDEELACITAYDEIMQVHLKSFLELSAKVGGDVAEAADLVKQAFIAQRRFMDVAPRSNKPGPKVLPDLLKATSEGIQEVVSYRDSHRASKQSDQLAALSEGISALSWVTVEPKPAPFVKDMTDAAEFYTNRVIKTFKDSDKLQADWAKSFINLLKELFSYVKQHHTTGLTWGKKIRSMTFWMNAIASTAPGEGDADKYIFSTRLGVPVTRS